MSFPTPGELHNRAYRLDLDLHAERAWSPKLLERRYSAPSSYTYWTQADGQRPSTDPETSFTASQVDHEAHSPVPTRSEFESPPTGIDDKAPFSPFSCQHSYPLISRGKEIATLTILSRANRTQARPLLCDGDSITGWITIPGDGISRVRRIELAFKQFIPGKTTAVSEIRRWMVPEDVLNDTESRSVNRGQLHWDFVLPVALAKESRVYRNKTSTSTGLLLPPPTPTQRGFCELSVIVTRRPRLSRNIALTKLIKFIPPLTTPPPSPTHRASRIARQQSEMWDERRSPVVVMKGELFGESVELECTLITPVTFPARLRTVIPIKLIVSSISASAIDFTAGSPSTLIDVRMSKVIAHGIEPVRNLSKSSSLWNPRSFHQNTKIGTVVWQQSEEPVFLPADSNHPAKYSLELRGDIEIISGMEREVQRSIQVNDLAILFLVVLYPFKPGNGFQPARGFSKRELVISQIKIE